MADNNNVSGRDRDVEAMDSQPTPGFSGSGGGSVATDVGSRDDERQAAGEEGGTRVTKEDEVTGRIPTRADHDGAGR